MKHMKKLVTLLLALIMALALVVPASAATTYTITINNAAAGHTYEAYQIFAGDLTVQDNNKILTEITWGSGVSATGQKALGDAATKAKSLTDEASAIAFAKEVAKYLQAPTSSGVQKNGKYTISGLAAGYYLVKDKNNTLSAKDDFYTAYIMKVVGDVTAAPKGDKPSMVKKVKHNETSTYGPVADHQIGDCVNFSVNCVIPDISSYTKYNFIIHDTMETSLTPDFTAENYIGKIFINDNKNREVDKQYYTMQLDGNSFALTINVKKLLDDSVAKTGETIVCYYDAILNENAKIYTEGPNVNTAYLEYSNNPNSELDTGKTPESTVYVWTFTTGINKVNESGNALTGAKFVLSKSDSLKVADMKCSDTGVPATTTDLINLVKIDAKTYRVATAADTANTTYVIDAGDVTIKGLDDAIDYYLYETLAPAGFNILKDPVKFKITAAYNEVGSALAKDNPTVTVGTGVASTAMKFNVVNQSGATLPETGGVGTTLFYIIGGVLMVGAAVLLVTRKRMNNTK